MRGARLEATDRAVVLAAAGRQWGIDKLAAALRTTYKTRPTRQHTGKVHLVEDNYEVDEMTEAPEEDEMSEVRALLAEHEPPEPPDEQIMEESEAYTVLATWSKAPATWKEARSNINATKLTRKFGGQQSPLEEVRRRVRCYNCKKIGPFSRDCKAPRRTKPSDSGKSSS